MSQRILLIQSDATAAAVVMGALADAGAATFEVEWVRTCAEGLERLNHTAAILVDLFLSDSHGIDTFDRLHYAGPTIPIMILSDLQNERVAKLAVQRGAQDYLLTCPLDAHHLPRVVGTMIARAAYAETQFEEKERARPTLNSIGDAIVIPNKLDQITCLIDSLTDLPNRALLIDRLNEALTLSSRYQRKLAILLLDLDYLRHINDSLGHVVGDLLLQSVARRLFTCVRSSDTVARLGSDQFVIALWEVKRAQDAGPIATKILEELRQPHYINEHELHVTGSIGIVTYPDDGADVEELIKKADSAMHHAKKNGRDRFQFFKSAMTAKTVRRQSLEASLRQAIVLHEFVLHYHSRLDLESGEVFGAEALIRWHHPQLGLMPPAQFIPIAQDCGLIVPIGRWVLRQACQQARAWQVAGAPFLSIAVNISAAELNSPDFVSDVRNILKDTGLEPRYLELELDETALIDEDDSRSVADVLRELKEIGILLALDNFGTVRSSFTSLKRLPVDALKIDPSLVRDLGRDQGGASTISTMIAMGKNLHMRVVAEGVETRQQLELLQQSGCPQAQGFYFGRPVPAEEFHRLLKCKGSATASA